MTAPSFNFHIFSTLLSEARASIGGNKLRTFLAMLGIVLGVSSVVLMVAIGSGSKRTVEDALASLGTDILIVSPGGGETHGLRWARSSSLDTGDADAMAQLPGIRAVSAVTQNKQLSLSAGSRHWYTRLTGVQQGFFSVRDWPLADGEAFSESDIAGAQRVVILGKEVAEKLFPKEMAEHISIIGQTIRIENTPFLVSGLLAGKGNSMAGNEDDSIYIPITTAQVRFFRDNDSDVIRAILAKTVSKETMRDDMADIGMVLRARHKLVETEADNFTVTDLASLTQVATNTADALSMLLAALAAISLIVGGIGIMNIMLVTVTERTREIGIRKAIGASDIDILIQFLLEAVMIACVGSLAGLIVGAGGGMVAQTSFGLRVEYNGLSVLLALIVALCVGIASGLYPAWKAAKLQPIQALRAQA